MRFEARFMQPLQTWHDYLKTLPPKARAMAEIVSDQISLMIVFGIRQQDRDFLQKYCQPEAEATILWVREGYLAGQWKPQDQSTQYMVTLVEGIAGGKPRPEDREWILPKFIESCMAVMDASEKFTLPSGKSTRPFVPLNDLDEKRKKALDKLNEAEADDHYTGG